VGQQKKSTTRAHKTLPITTTKTTAGYVLQLLVARVRALAKKAVYMSACT
jgi:hypothetical protein